MMKMVLTTIIFKMRKYPMCWSSFTRLSSCKSSPAPPTGVNTIFDQIRPIDLWSWDGADLRPDTDQPTHMWSHIRTSTIIICCSVVDTNSNHRKLNIISGSRNSVLNNENNFCCPYQLIVVVSSIICSSLLWSEPLTGDKLNKRMLNYERCWELGGYDSYFLSFVNKHSGDWCGC